ncbi:hypothetical protein BDF20DRAFT_903803 [Mycotypha africana]|uniref:uncharacterized protein n=1 Tax=Mycotypha africana TaxID=64632 RepID=UPI00230187C1|nr:uncharacterized protein BDF20DRAFT_903803 [Mycotypha africana]KAI8990775.1 hypothetical protein BDF20DRAFT_903803 [Mycotypha africana]
MNLAETELTKHKNTGVKIATIKCLQVIVILLSNTSYLRADHRLLKSQELEKEGTDVFNHILEAMKSDTESIITATISCLTLIVKKRPQFIKPVIEAFTTWKKTRPKEESPITYRNVDKAIKLAFISLIRTESLITHRSDLISAFGMVGGNVAIFQRRDQQRSEEAARRKRAASQHQQQDSDRADKRAKTSTSQTEYVIPTNSQNNILANYDITRIPLQHVVQLCMTVLQNVPIEVMTERVQLLPPEGVTLAVNRPGFISGSSTPPYPPPYDQPKYINDTRFRRENDIPAQQAKLSGNEAADFMNDYQPSKKLEGMLDSDEDEEMPQSTSIDASLRAKIAKEEEQLMRLEKEDSKPKVELLASVEERASQALKLKPYELDRQQTILGNAEKRKLIKMSVDRILQAGVLFDTNLVLNSTNMKSIWLMLISKLLTKGTNIMDIADATECSKKKDSDEEMMEDKKAITIHDDEHEDLLETCIPKLDAKDRNLTKLVLEAPDVDITVIDMIKNNLETVSERFVSCVSTLRSLVTNRPTIRYAALDVLLNLCINEDDKKRRTSIVAVKKWNPNQAEIFERVEKFSIESLHNLTKPIKEQQQTNNDDDANNDWTEKDVVRFAELFFVLCTRRPVLLKELFDVYIKASNKVKKLIQLHIVSMIKSIGMRSQDLVSLVKEFPIGGESLVIRILSILCESKPPTREIVATVQSISNLASERSIDLTSISPILSGKSLSTVQQQKQPGGNIQT